MLALRNFTHYGGGEKAIALMDQLFKDYKHTQKHEEYRYAVWTRLQEAIERVKQKDSSEAMKKKINSAVVEINQLAKKYGYEKPPKG